MKTMTVVAIALAAGMGTASAQGNGGPSPPTTPFAIWSMQSAGGKPFTSMPELMHKAQNGEALNSAPTPRGLAAQNSPAPGAAVPN